MRDLSRVRNRHNWRRWKNRYAVSEWIRQPVWDSCVSFAAWRLCARSGASGFGFGQAIPGLHFGVEPTWRLVRANRLLAQRRRGAKNRRHERRNPRNRAQRVVRARTAGYDLTHFERSVVARAETIAGGFLLHETRLVRDHASPDSKAVGTRRSIPGPHAPGRLGLDRHSLAANA